MAESTGSKTKKTLDAFADDLDAMLNIGDDAEQEVGAIEDDEAIDRLLVGDESFERNAEQEVDEFADIDDLLSENQSLVNSNLADDIDEFSGDLDVDIPINPGLDQQALDDEFADILEAANLKPVDVDVDEEFAEVAALERVEPIDEFVDDDSSVALELPVEEDELENMAEIDEFSGDAELSTGNADFLVADFDISADDEFVAPAVVDEFADSPTPVPEVPEEPPASVAVQSLEAAIDDENDEEALVVVQEPEVASSTEPEPAAPIQAPPVPPIQVVDHSSDIAALNRSIVDLKKHQQQIKHDLTEMAGKSELLSCLDGLESVQTEQKKTKRALDALAARKPVAAYVANGVAAAALLIGTGLGIQGMIAKSQVGELVTIVGKLQEQMNAAPTSDAADKEMLRKQLDELTVSNGVMATQLAELSKAAHTDAGAKAGGEQGKPAGEVGNQIMQIGAAIETLQNKVSALEKGRTLAAAPAPKPEKKKPVPVVENWAVNLIAFKQDWYAKSKAQEFAGKGVPAKVVKAESKGENWYRLYVDGFTSQYEAAAYAAKIKKTLNLDSVWVTRNKE